MSRIRIGTLGKIKAGKDAGRVVEVIDDVADTGGYLIFTYADARRAPPVFDSWVMNFHEVQRYFAESKWDIEWLES